jgi:uncharacterized protein (DUF433 family)
MMDYKNFIVRNPEIMMGKPTIKGTRITVELIMRKLAGGYSVDVLLESYPFLNLQQINAVFQFAAELIANEETIEVT